MWRSFQQCYDMLVFRWNCTVRQLYTPQPRQCKPKQWSLPHWSFRISFAVFHSLQELQLKLGPFLAGDKNLLVIEEGRV